MKEFIINKNDSGQRVDKFLTKAVPALPKNLLYKYIRLKRIKVNGKRCEISTRLSENDVMQLYINDEFFGESDETGGRPAFLRSGPVAAGVQAPPPFTPLLQALILYTRTKILYSAIKSADL